MDPIPLSEAVSELRQELKRALDDADDKILLSVKEIELELTLDFSRQQGGGLKLSIPSLIGADANASRSTGRLHRVKLTLNPVFDPQDGEPPATLNLSASESGDGSW